MLYGRAVTTMTASEARAALPELLNRVEQGEEITITRHGRVAAVLVHPDVLRGRLSNPAFAAAERVGELLEAARRTPLSRTRALTPEYAEELIAEIRAGRDAR